jgi:hypothetical protein
MSSSLADRTNTLALAAAMSRHPAAGAQAAATPPGGASFTAVAALLTGPWRVNDPVAFASAMRSAPLVAGHPVVDLCACARRPTVQLDPLSAAAAGHLESAVAAAAGRSALTVRWVAAVGGRCLFVETAAQAPADGEGPELLVLAHLVENAGGPVPIDDDSWVVIVVGDGRGGVAAVGRAPLSRHDRLPARLGLGALRDRLAGPARLAEGLGTAAPAEAVVLPFRR